MEGSFAGVQSEAHSPLVQAKGERAEVKKRQDNLKMEGSMQLVSEARSAAQAIQKVNFKSGGGRRDVHSSSIVIGDDASSTTKAIEQHEAKRQASSSSTTVRKTSATSAKSTAVEKQSQSTGVA